MIKKSSLIWIILLITITTVNCHKIVGKSSKLTEQDKVISDFLYNNFNISIRVKLLWQLFFSINGAILVGLSGILPLLFISSETGAYLRSKGGITSLNRWLSFAFGSIIGDVFLHLLPEVWEEIEESNVKNSQIVLGVWIIFGFFIFFVIEKVFIENNADELEHQPQTKSTNNKSLTNKKSTDCNGDVVKDYNIIESGIKAEGYLNLMANFTDNFTHGLAIGGSFLISFKIGALTTTCILIHEIPHEVSDFVILLRAGFDRWKAAKCQLFTAGGSILGSVFALTADSTTTGLSKTYILPFTSGAFIYIAMVSLLPSILAEHSFRESVIQLTLITIGFVIMVTMSQCCV